MKLERKHGKQIRFTIPASLRAVPSPSKALAAAEGGGSPERIDRAVSTAPSCFDPGSRSCCEEQSFAHKAATHTFLNKLLFL